MRYAISVVDDESSIRQGIAMALQEQYDVQGFVTAESALEAMKETLFDLVLLDIGLPGMNGVDALRHIKEQNPDTLVIMITAYEDVKTVVSAMKLGAFDYVVKPIQMPALRVTIENALATIRLRKEVQAAQERLLAEQVPCFVGESNVIQDVMEFIRRVARSPDTPVLIEGETGTGKELIANAIHYWSPNYRGPLVTVNCAAIPRELVESELFGYESGAFSGARAGGKAGLVQDAEHGTLFLDEVGDLSLEAQAKLLRFLEAGEFHRVGGNETIRVETRVVSATNKSLMQLIEEGEFRRDLYFRIGVIRVTVPSLNERRDDILPLAKHFMLEFADKFGKRLHGMTPEAERALLARNWTGNVRELKNMLEAAVLTTAREQLSEEDLGLDDMSAYDATSPSAFLSGTPPIPLEGLDLSRVMDAVQKHYIREALRLAKGNESQAARLLGLNHHTFRYRRRKLGVD